MSTQFLGQLDPLSFVMVLCCLLAMIPSLMKRGGGDGDIGPSADIDLWYTTQSINETYTLIAHEITGWREKASTEGSRVSTFTRLRRAFTRAGNTGRYVVQEEVPPKLLKLRDSEVGTIYFELTEVDADMGGGTVVKASYRRPAKTMIALLKTRLPVKIPAVPIGDRCPSCGKTVLSEFKLCPYCGQQLVGE